jgi:Fe-S-cluster-containing dehydrogenase component
MAACPNEAIFRTSKGVVMVNNKKCDGTGACIAACPYSAIHLNPDTGKAIKCIQCGECVERCPADAIRITTSSELKERDPDERILKLHDENQKELYGRPTE